MTEDLATLIKIIIVAVSLYILWRSFGGTKEDQEDLMTQFFLWAEKGGDK